MSGEVCSPGLAGEAQGAQPHSERAQVDFNGLPPLKP